MADRKYKHQNDQGKWKFFTGDMNFLDYGGTWMWSDDPGHSYWFIKLDSWENMVGAREVEADGLAKYNITLSHVELDGLNPKDVRSALSSMDLTDTVEAESNPVRRAELIAYACLEYGECGRALDESGNNWRELFKSASREAY